MSEAWEHAWFGSPVFSRLFLGGAFLIIAGWAGFIAPDGYFDTGGRSIRPYAAAMAAIGVLMLAAAALVFRSIFRRLREEHRP